MQPAVKRATFPAGGGRSKASAQYALLGAVFVIATVYQGFVTWNTTHRPEVGVPFFALETASARVEIAKADAVDAGLHPGDLLLAVNGRPYSGTAVLSREIANAVPGGALALTVRKPDGTARTLQLPVSRRATSLGDTAIQLLGSAVIPYTCLLLGCWVVLVRPRDALAWLLMAMLLGFGQLFGAGTIETWPSGIAQAAMAYRVALISAWPIFMFLFGFYFPEPFPEGEWLRRNWKTIAWLLLAPSAFLGLIEVVVSAGEISNYAAVAPLYNMTLAFHGALHAVPYITTGGFFCFIFMKSADPSLPVDARRRLRLLYWGATVALTPGLIVATVAATKGTAFELLPPWMTYSSLLMLILFPLTLAYVIVVQRAMDVSVVVRQGLQYGLAKNGIRVLQFVAIGIVIAVAFAVGSHANRPQQIVVIALAVTLGFSIPRLGEPLRDWTDRRFFREAYNAEQVLSELGDQVRSIVETRPLIETVAERISTTLHVPLVAVFLGGTGPYRPAYALGYDGAPDLAFPNETGAVKTMQKQNEPVRVYFDDPNSWMYRDPGVSDGDRANLAQLESELLLPLSARDKLLGFISLGAKRSDQPYSSTDVRLLKSVAAQTGLALENARLMNAIAEEVGQRERLNREVEIAREVQERLFPQTLPPIQGIEYAGACRPALGVGGDYYDFLALPGGQLGIAIGDVSGKGIAAALTMATLQASLRGEATRAPDDLAALVGNVNRLVFEASSSSRYATFFYGQYNPASRQFNYVNAGHNPPMLFHCSTGKWTISRLETGGTVVGLLESFPYQQAAVTIAPGDILVAFTDGISEAMNHADEEWGEDQLKETMQGCMDLGPAETIRRIMLAADTFVAGAKQHDDMTLVVLHAQAQA
jgi:phosphoserine phosphatase RsbU/P